MMRALTFSVAVVALVLLFQACTTDPVGPVGPLPIPFNLTVPPNRPVGQYYAMSGVTTNTVLIRVGDSLQESEVPSFYAQFDRGDAVPQPTSVKLNGNPLERNLGSDTLRLSTAPLGNVFGDNTWTVGDAAGDTSFTMATVDIVDSVEPFRLKKTFRSDTNLVISWKLPRFGSSGMYIIWRSPQAVLVRAVTDFIGRETLTADDLIRLRGDGTVTLLRYVNAQKSFRGNVLVATRVAQRTYNVTVQ